MKTFRFLTVMLILGSCIDPIELGLPSAGDLLVVDGLITNDAGPYKISLSRSLAFNSDNILTSYFVPEKNATINVVDDLNNTYLFTETQPGRYTSDAEFQGQIGRSYKLMVQTQNDQDYESEFEALLSVPAIETIIPKFVEIEKISNTGFIVKDYGFEIAVNTIDPSDEANYYRWTSSGIIEFLSIAEGPPVVCWYDVPILHDQVQVQDDRFSNGKVLSQTIGMAPYERPTRIRVDVNQYSLSQKAFEFWKQISNQQQNTGSVFDPPPAKIKGNVFNSQNTNEMVLGYFGVSAVSKKYLVFSRNEASNFFQPPNAIPALQGSCLNHVFGSYSTKPDGF